LHLTSSSMKCFQLIPILISVISEAYAQNDKINTFKADNFSINYPSNWITTNDNGIRNFFPKDEYGAVTISKYSDVDLTLEMTKQFILEMNEVKDNPDNVVATKKNNFLEFNYEHIDHINKIKWITRAIRKGNDFYLLTINCELSKWPSSKLTFLNVLESFRVE
jgi:hypothetical protein